MRGEAKEEVLKNIHRIAAAIVFLFVASLPLFAQTRPSSDVGVFLVNPNLDSSTVVDTGDTISFDFKEKTSYGVSLNRYWNDNFSTELALQKIRADLKIDSSGLPVSINAGRLDATSITALGEWHFLQASRFSPYVGAGIAHISGDFKFNDLFAEPGDPTHVDLESKTTWSAAAGANIRLTDRIAIGTELKYIPWSAVEKGGAISDAIDVNPLTFAAGLRFKF